MLPWGADPDRFHPNVLPLDRAAFNLTPTEQVILALGRLVPKKGFDILIVAFGALLRTCPEAQLVIGGTGPQAQDLERLARQHGLEKHLHLVGPIPWQNVPGFLAMADVFVLPSVHDPAGNVDGLPTVLLEAMAVGKPVVASRIAGVPLVIEDGVNGLLCPQGDADTLSRQMAMLLAESELRKRLGRAACAAVVEHFNWPICSPRSDRPF